MKLTVWCLRQPLKEYRWVFSSKLFTNLTWRDSIILLSSGIMWVFITTGDDFISIKLSSIKCWIYWRVKALKSIYLVIAFWLISFIRTLFLTIFYKLKTIRIDDKDISLNWYKIDYFYSLLPSSLIPLIFTGKWEAKSVDRRCYFISERYIWVGLTIIFPKESI